MLSLLFLAQFVAFAELIRRLLPGRTRLPPVLPQSPLADTTVSVIVTSLNEAHRIQPCLAALSKQGAPVLEILLVDSRSTDGTRELIETAMRSDARMKLLTDDPLPHGWVGKVWALQHGLTAARGEWVLGVDADTEPVPGMVAGVVAAARMYHYDVVSFSPRFAGQSALEQWLQPALLRTLVYRAGAAGTRAGDRVLANGQCFLARRETLLRHGGYSGARDSFADDVTLARTLAANGVRVGFLDGSELYTVRSYRSAGEMWREWGRSIDLKDATAPVSQWLDIAFLVAAQGLPVLLLVAFTIHRMITPHVAPEWATLTVLNALLIAVHVLMLIPLAPSYAQRKFTYWLSWIADPVAVLRIVLSTVRRSRSWRGRQYPARAT